MRDAGVAFREDISPGRAGRRSHERQCRGPTEDTRGGVYSRSFLALVATQFFVSLNDNMFRWLVVPIGKELLHGHWAEMPAMHSRLDEAGGRCVCRWGWHVSRCRF